MFGISERDLRNRIVEEKRLKKKELISKAIEVLDNKIIL